GKKSSFNWWIEPDDVEYKAVSDTHSSIQIKSKDTATLIVPNYEFLIDQHPELSFEVNSGDRSWEVKVYFEREFDYSPPSGSPVRTLFRSKPQKSNQKLNIPLSKILRSKGYQSRYMRVRISITISKGNQNKILFQAYAKTKSVVVPQLPQTVAITRKPEGIPIHAIAIDDSGQIISSKQISVTLTCNKKTYPMKPVKKTGIFQAIVSNLAVGTYQIHINADLPKPVGLFSTTTTLSVTNGSFVEHVFDKQCHHAGYIRAGKHLGFLSGSTSLCDLIPAFHVGTEKETLVFDTEEYKTKSKNSDGKLDGVLLTSLTTAELDRWLEHRAGSGYRCWVISNWTPDILNVGGKISPYGAELLSHILNFSRLHGIYAKVDIHHDTLCRLAGIHGKSTEHIIALPNLTQYAEAGFLKDMQSLITDCHGLQGEFRKIVFDQWCRPKIRKIHEQYFHHFLMLFRDETAIMMLSTSGEGDGEMGARLANPLNDFIRTLDSNHLLCTDRAMHFYTRFRTPHFDPELTAMPFKARHHRCMPVDSVGENKTDVGMAVLYKFFSLDPDGIYGEGDCFVSNPFFPPSWDPKFDTIHPWSDEAKLLVRDFLWISIIHRVFMVYNWNEVFTADEHLMPTQISHLIDWDRFVPRIPPVILRVRTLQNPVVVQGHTVQGQDLLNMNYYEEAFSACGLDYGYVWEQDPLPGGTDVYWHKDRNKPPFLVLDIKERVDRSIFENNLMRMPQSVHNAHVIHLSGKGYLASSLLSENLDQAIIYLRNTTQYIEAPRGDLHSRDRHHWMRGNRKQGDLQIKLVHFPDKPKRVRVYDLDTKSLLLDEKFRCEWKFSEENTDHDYVIVITPQERVLSRLKIGA
ncbi:hypothetical protein KAW08_06115, partial [bacterium]|nr:hypothetical protein [bacterium]